MRALHRKDGGIFTRTRLPDDEQKLSVGLLVDESGSMGWEIVLPMPGKLQSCCMISV